MELKRDDYDGQIEKGDGCVNIGPDAPRYAIFSDTKGVYLGEYEWSYEPEAEKHDRAMTYVKFQADQVIKDLVENKGIKGCIAVRVQPDRRFGLASIKACEAAGLPTWEYNAEKYDKDRKVYYEDEVEDAADEDPHPEVPETPEIGGES